MSASNVVEDGPRPSLSIASLKEKVLSLNTLPAGGALSPDIKPAGFYPQLLPGSVDQGSPSVECIGKYLLLEKLSTTSTTVTYKALHIGLQEEFVCKVFALSKYRELLAPYWVCGSHAHIAHIVEILLGVSHAYVIFRRCHDDLHSYIRRKRRLREGEAAELFRQIVSAIKHCHKRGIVLRDLKLRKFVFANPQRSELVLEGLEDACLLSDTDDDRLTDKHGCPAYVSPEILSSHGYSGKSADMWSLGVILYTMLFGQYPFHDTVASQLFGKIRRGHYTVPDSVSASARCLVKGLLRTEPSERLSVCEAARHPWFTLASAPHHAKLLSATLPPALGVKGAGGARGGEDQRVPELLTPSQQHEFSL
jgi:tribbles-like protein